MTTDPLLPIAPARVRALLVPLGRITADRFAEFLARLRREHVVHLRDVTPDRRPNRNMFSPLGCPDGRIIYDLATHLPPPSHLALTPFDLWREPLVVLAVADGRELDSPLDGGADPDGSSSNASGPSAPERNLRALYQQLEQLRDTHAKALVHRVVIFDYEPPLSPAPDPIPIPEGIMTVPAPNPSLETAAAAARASVRGIMGGVSSVLLAEMTSLARSLEAMTHIESPGQSAATAGELGPGVAAARRISQIPTTSSRSSSADRGQNPARMSMPPVAFHPSPSLSSGGGRPSTPIRSGLSNPPTTFDDMSAAPENGSRSTPPNSRPGTADREGGASADSTWSSPPPPGREDRVSMQGFGPGSLSEQMRSKGRGRAAVVIGSLYLQAGRWKDALRELAEAANMARATADHIWHGKALELILVTVLLMGWAELDFLVPPSLLPIHERFNAANNSASQPQSQQPQIQEVDAAQPRHLQQLQGIVPDLLERILALYSRAAGESLPALPAAETTIRFCKILAAMYLAGGKLIRASLEMMVTGLVGPQQKHRPTTATGLRLSIAPTREYIVRLAYRAFPSSAPELLTIADRAAILSGIASVLGLVGALRKRAMVMRELVSVLATGLVEARTRGAADVGIHPAAGLVALTGGAGAGGARKTSGLDLDPADVEQGIDRLLGRLCGLYGVPAYDVALELLDDRDDRAADTNPDANPDASPDASPDPDHHQNYDHDESSPARIRGHAAARFFGFPDIKLNVLRACISLCEALPDLAGVLRFSSDLMRTAATGGAIDRNEQVRLVGAIGRTALLAGRLGPAAVAAEYWDEFLVRAVSLDPIPASRIAVARSGLEGGMGGGRSKRRRSPSSTSLPPPPPPPPTGLDDGGETAKKKNPFIYSAFAAASPDDPDAADRTLVAGERASFIVVLQNRSDAELDVESVRLDVAGVKFDSAPVSCRLGPRRAQAVRVWATPLEPGAARVIGAVARIRGCRERPFPILARASTTRPDSRVKATGLAGLRRTLAAAAAAAAAPPSAAEEILLTVIPAQPLVAVQTTTLPQSSVMLLEGERRRFKVTLRNLSTKTPVDRMLFSFEDSTQEPLRAALKNRDATAAELYEYELLLFKTPALRLLADDSEDKLKGPEGKRGTRGGGEGDEEEEDGEEAVPGLEMQRRRQHMAPGAAAVFEFEILGRPGLTSAVIRLDYGHMGGVEHHHQLYARQVAVHLTITVNASVELARLDVLSPGGSIRDHDENQDSCYDDGPQNCCLLLLDFRNAYPSLMTVELSGSDSSVGPAAITESILPGSTARLALPVRRIRVADPFAPVPSLSPAGRQRQFVVSRSVSAEMERAAREAFWFREGILGGVRCRWTSGGKSGARGGSGGGDGRSGYVDLRGIRMGPRMIEAARIDDVSLEVWVERPGGGVRDAAEPRTGRATVRVDEFVQIRLRLINRTGQPIRPLVRLQPALRHRAQHVALDHVRKFAWNGTLQRALGVVGAGGGAAELVVGATALCRGEFEVGASAEEVVAAAAAGGGRGAGGGEGEDEEGERGRERERERERERRGGGERARRVWYCKRPCVLVVGDD